MEADIKTFATSELVKERKFDENPRRHFTDVRLMLCDRILTQLEKDGFLKEEIVPTAVPNQFTMTLTLRAIK